MGGYDGMELVQTKIAQSWDGGQNSCDDDMDCEWGWFCTNGGCAQCDAGDGISCHRQQVVSFSDTLLFNAVDDNGDDAINYTECVKFVSHKGCRECITGAMPELQTVAQV